MTPIQESLLREVEKRKLESTITFLVNKTEGQDEKYVQRAVQDFAKNGLVRYTGSGEFEITNKGLEYLGIDTVGAKD